VFMDSGLAGKPTPRNDDIPAFFCTLLREILPGKTTGQNHSKSDYSTMWDANEPVQD